MSDGLEVKLLGMRHVASGEVHLSFAVQKDDAPKTAHLIGKVGQPFVMALGRINYEATEDFVPLTSADLTQGARNSVDSPVENDSHYPATNGDGNFLEGKTPEDPPLDKPPGTFSKRAALWCSRGDVQLYMNKAYGIPRNFDSARGKVKELLDIKSFTEITEGSTAAADYLALELKFKMWMDSPRYVAE